MGVFVRKKEGESDSSVIYRFTKKMRQSGIMKEAKKRRFRDRNVNKTKIKLSAAYRENKRKEIEEAKKAGLL
jgi:ribosomal protein S21